ncbi:type II secretion system secretin GspD (plasmid) [Amphritea atlantica]|uniref:Type II secretion system secretin GspD n=1 Tax=Amphritea atlantica TaxID=355243 RepID=A0ABY5H143_9GAMM|nr:type II secretion system secretin GspD [Amphritea atlantica]
MIKRSPRIHSFLLLSCVVLAACSSYNENRAAMDNPWNQPEQKAVQVTFPSSEITDTDPQSTPADQSRFAQEGPDTSAPSLPSYELYQGDGRFMNLEPIKQRQATESEEGDVTLNFQEAEISEVVKTILGDILQRNYSIDDKVRGSAYIQTSEPIPRKALIPILEHVLQINGAALVEVNGFYEVVPADAVPASKLSISSQLTAGKGYQVLVVPLKYISAKEMLKILEPIKPRQGLIEADERRNLLILAGTQEELINLNQTIRVFDIDQLLGMSVGLFRLKSVKPDVLVDELEAIFGDKAEGPLAGVVRYMPIERLNALLVMTSQRKYLKDARVWIERLDRAETAGGLGMYVYYVQNGKAENLANMLSELFSGQRRAQGNRPQVTTPPATATSGDSDAEPLAEQPGSPTDLNVGEVSIIADEENNALLILASTGDYEKVVAALNKLDVLPLQVLVEATIIEVTLEDELRFGLQWFFKNSIGNRTGRGTLGASLNSGDGITAPFAPSASYEVFDAVSTRLLLTALAKDSKVNVISSPSLMVLDNHTASIRVGDQVPVRTSETTNTSSESNITSTIQFKDTGVLLEVTPRVNAGGMVVLDIAQEVNDVSDTTSSGIDSPTITQRKIDTSVAVQSGETLVLGGLIKENKENSDEGVPGARHIPVFGWLFSSDRKFKKRTELVVLITPTAVTDRSEARDVTREFRNKLQGVFNTPEKGAKTAL